MIDILPWHHISLLGAYLAYISHSDKFRVTIRLAQWVQFTICSSIALLRCSSIEQRKFRFDIQSVNGTRLDTQIIGWFEKKIQVDRSRLFHNSNRKHGY